MDKGMNHFINILAVLCGLCPLGIDSKVIVISNPVKAYCAYCKKDERGQDYQIEIVIFKLHGCTTECIPGQYR